MKAVAAVALILLAFVVWWPAGIALLLFALWRIGSSREQDKAEHNVSEVSVPQVEVAQDSTEALLRENRALKHEINQREAERVGAAITQKIDELLDDGALKNPHLPAYHAWQIISDITYKATTDAHHADPPRRAALLALLTYIEASSDSIVRAACTDERWTLFEGRELEFQDFQEMRGLAHEIVDEVIRVATRSADR